MGRGPRPFPRSATHAAGREVRTTTSDHLLGVLDVLQAAPELCSHLEMETYTWEVLPPELKSRSVADQLAAEYEWVLRELRRRAAWRESDERNWNNLVRFLRPPSKFRTLLHIGARFQPAHRLVQLPGRLLARRRRPWWRWIRLCLRRHPPLPRRNVFARCRVTRITTAKTAAPGPFPRARSRKKKPGSGDSACWPWARRELICGGDNRRRPHAAVDRLHSSLQPHAQTGRVSAVLDGGLPLAGLFGVGLAWRGRG